MTDTDLLSAFDDGVIRAVASENDVEEATLVEALEDHQRTMRDNPGVEDLVYEWRKRFESPVLSQTDSRYVVAVRVSVWEEFGSYLDLDEDVLAAVAAVHQEQVVRSLTPAELDFADGLVPLVVVRSGSGGAD